MFEPEPVTRASLVSSARLLFDALGWIYMAHVAEMRGEKAMGLPLSLHEDTYDTWQSSRQWTA